MSDHMEPWSTRNLDNIDIVYYCQQTRGHRTFPGWNTLDRSHDPPQWKGFPLNHHFSETLFENQLSSRRVLNSRLVSNGA
jgi:hypothetical protein